MNHEKKKEERETNRMDADEGSSTYSLYATVNPTQPKDGTNERINREIMDMHMHKQSVSPQVCYIGLRLPRGILE